MYLDLDVINNDYTRVGSSSHLRFEEIRNTPFLGGDSSDYFCSIVRFTVQTGNTLPLFIPVVELDQGNKDKTIYKVTIEYEYQGQTYSDTSSLYYYSLDKTAPLPSPPMVKQDLSSNYYHIHNYNHFINMINIALESTFKAVKSSLPEINGVTPLDTTTFPFLDFDPHTNKIVVYAEYYFYDEIITNMTNRSPNKSIF